MEYALSFAGRTILYLKFFVQRKPRNSIMNKNKKLYPIILMSGALIGPSAFAGDQTPWYNPTGWFDDDSEEYTEVYGDRDVDAVNLQHAGEGSSNYRNSAYPTPNEREMANNESAAYGHSYSYGDAERAEAVWYWDDPQVKDQSNTQRMQNSQRFSQNDLIIITNEPIQYSFEDAKRGDMPSGQVSGKIQKIEDLEIGNSSNRNPLQLATVKLDDGSSVHVSLGQKNDLKKLGLSEGDEVQIKGTAGRITSSKLIIAEEVTSGQQRVAVNQDAVSPRANQRSQSQQFAQGKDNRYQSNRSGSQQAERQYVSSGDNWNPSDERSQSTSQFKSDQYQTVSGKIDGFKRVKVGEGGENLFVKLTMENGQSAYVNLGSIESAGSVELRKGEHVEIQGTRKQMDGKTVLEAKNINVGSNEHSFESSGMQQREGEARNKSY